MQSTRPRRLTSLFYAIGQNAEGVQSAAFHTFLLFYYQQVIGVSGTLTGLALALALCADAATDPVAGSLSDRTSGRFGRRHPFIVSSAIPLGISFVMLFNPPAGLTELGNFAWLLAFAILVRICLTFYQIPHLALGAELATNTVDRSALFNMAALARMGGEGLVPLLAYLMFFPTTPDYHPGTLNAAGYLPFSLFFAAWMILVILLSAWGTRHEIPRLRQTQAGPATAWHSGYREMVDALANRAFRTLFLFIFVFSLISSVTGVVSPFMAFHFWGLTTETLAMIVVLAAPAVIPTLYLVPWLTSRFDKRDILMGSTAVLVVSTTWAVLCRLLDLDWFPANGTLWITAIVLLNTALFAMTLPVFISASDSMMADIADEIELTTGERREGLLFAARAFTAKATGSLGLLIGGATLDLIDFPRQASVGSVPPATIWHLGVIAGPATSFLMLLSIGLLLRYPLTRERYLAIQRDLGQKQRQDR
ncbi:MAG: MFS transporter [Pseudomonadota bacterium]